MTKKEFNYLNYPWLPVNIPLVLPSIEIDGINVDGYTLIIRTFAFENKRPYLVFRYENPSNPKEYIFHSHSFLQLQEYLIDYKCNV